MPSAKELADEMFSSSQPESQPASSASASALADEFFSQTAPDASNAPTGSFGQTTYSTPDDSPANVPYGKQLVAGMLNNPESKAAYFKEQYPESNVEIAKTGDIKIDGKFVNPTGLGIQDLAQASGDILPFIGQVVASVVGNVSSGGVSLPATMAIGTAGALAGEGLNQLILNELGVSRDGKEVSNAFLQEAIAAAGGEAVGYGAKKLLDKALVARGKAELLSKSYKAIEKSTGSREAATTVAQIVSGKDKPLWDAYIDSGMIDDGVEAQMAAFAPDAHAKIVSRVLTGTNNTAKIVRNLAETKAGTNVDVLMEDVVKNIKQADSPDYEMLLKNIDQNAFDDTTLTRIKEHNIEDIFKKENFHTDRPQQIATSLEKELLEVKKVLGDKVGAAEKEAIKSKPNAPFNVGVTKDVERLMTALDTKEKGIITAGGQFIKGVPVRGGKEAREVLDLLSGQFDLVKGAESTGGKKVLKKVTRAEAINLRKKFDSVVDAFFKADADPELTREMTGLAAKFRDNYYTQLGIADEAAKYRLFQETFEELRINKTAVQDAVKNMVVGFDRRASGKANSFIRLAQETPRGERLINEVELYNLGQKLAKTKFANLSNKFTQMISDPSVLNPLEEKTMEGVLRNISARLGGNPKTRNLRFFEDSQKALIAQKLGESSINLLRMQTIAGMLGFGIGGPLGAAGGLAASAIVSNPKNVAKVLGVLRKRGFITSVNDPIKTAKLPVKKATPTGNAKVLADLIKKTAPAATAYGIGEVNSQKNKARQ